MKPDIFDDIGDYVPETHVEAYWRMVARFRHLKPDDEILNIFLAMGILTFILRSLPAALIEEKKGWKTQIDLCCAEMRTMIEESTRHAVTVNNQTETMQKALQTGSVLLNESASRIESVSEEVIKQIDVSEIARRFTIEIEQRVVLPFQILTEKSANQIHAIEKMGESAENSMKRLRRTHVGMIMAVVCAAAFVFWGSIFKLSLDDIQKTNEVALRDKLAEIKELALADQATLLQLASNSIKIQIVGVSRNGETQLGEKALRLTPSYGVTEEKPDGLPQSGVIYFRGY